MDRHPIFLLRTAEADKDNIGRSRVYFARDSGVLLVGPARIGIIIIGPAAHGLDPLIVHAEAQAARSKDGRPAAGQGIVILPLIDLAEATEWLVAKVARLDDATRAVLLAVR